MAATFVAASAVWTVSLNDPAIPSGTAAGDRMFLFCVAKPYDATFDAISGWTRLDAACGTNGTTASSVDLGSVKWEVWYRDWQSGDAAPAVNWSGTINVALNVIHTVRKTLAAFDIAACKGGDTTSGTALSITMDADPGITSGDLLLGFSGIAGNDATFASPVISAASATIGSATEAPAAEGSTTGGNDLEASACYAACTAGAGTAAPVLAWTLSAAQTGGGCIIRVRDVAAGGSIPVIMNQYRQRRN